MALPPFLQGIDIYTGKRVAVKAIHRHKLRKVTGAAQAVEREIMIMRQLSQSRSGPGWSQPLKPLCPVNQICLH